MIKTELENLLNSLGVPVNEGTPEDFIASLKGAPGADAKSIYELYVESGGTMSEDEFIASQIVPTSWGAF